MAFHRWFGGNIVGLGLVVRPISSIHHSDPCVSSMQFFPTIPHAPGEPAPDLPKFPIRLAVNFVDFGDCESSDSPHVCHPHLKHRLQHPQEYVGRVHCDGEQGATGCAMGKESVCLSTRPT